jgi:hypothetical protein
MAPQVMYVMEGLAARGISLSGSAITVEQALASIMGAMDSNVT